MLQLVSTSTYEPRRRMGNDCKANSSVESSALCIYFNKTTGLDPRWLCYSSFHRHLSKVLSCGQLLQEGEKPIHLSASTSKPFMFGQSCRKQLGPSCISLDNTFLPVTKQGSHFLCCLVKALSEVKHKAGP